MTDPRIDPLPSALREWADEQATREIVRIPPGLIRLKARLSREEARTAKVRSLQRWVLSLVALASLAATLLIFPRGTPGLQSITISGLGTQLGLLLAPLLFTASVAGFLET